MRSGHYSPTRLLGLLLILLVCALPGGLNGLAAAATAEPRTVRVAAFPYYPGIYREESGVVRGFIVDILNDVARAENWRLEFIPGSWQEGLDRAQSGEVDLLTSVAYTEERAQFLDFGQEPMLRVWGEVYVREGSPIRELLGMNGATVATMHGDFNAMAFEKLMQSFSLHVNLRGYDDFEQVFGAVARGEVDAGVVNSVVGQGRASRYRLTSTGIVFNPFPIYFVVAKGRHADLLSVLDAYLLRWKADRTSPYYQAIERWTKQQAQVVREIPPLVRQVIIGLLTVLLICMAFALTLRMRVRRATQSILASESRYRLLFDQMMTGFALHEIICDADGKPIDYRFLAINAAFEQMTGLRPEELIGHTVREVMPQTESTWIERYGRVALTGEPDQFEDYSSALDRYYEVRAYSPDRGQFAVLVLDVTRTRQAEAALRGSEERLRFAMEATSDGIWDWDALTDHIYFSPRVFEMLGYPTDAFPVTFQRWLDLLPPEQRQSKSAELGQQIAEADTFQLEFDMQAADGHYVPILGRGKVVARTAEGKPVRLTGTNTDLTERRRADEDRLRLERQMLQAQKMESLGVLAGGIAHDFNNLLMAVMGHAELALHFLPPGARAERSLREIQKASVRAAELCRQMLAYSGKGSFIIEPVEINLLIEEMLHLLGTSISKKAHLQLNLDAIGQPIMADATQLRQVAMNLVLNASEALNDQEGTITITTGTLVWPATVGKLKLHDEPPAPGHYAWLEVADTGCGMDPATQARLFEPFFTTKFTGRGLGMAAVLGIVRSHKGALLLHSEPGHGTIFRVLLPTSTAPLPIAEPLPPDARPWDLQRTILLVDDEESVRMVVCGMLEQLGLRVLTACDGREALRVHEEHRHEIDLLLLDQTMPQMDGVETLYALQAAGARVPVVMCSGYTEQDLLGRYGDLRLAGFIQKPYTLRELQRAMQQAWGEPCKRDD